MFSFFIAKRIYHSQEGGKRISRPAVLIAMIGVAIGFTVMLLSVAVVTGYKKEIREKITGFGADIQLSNFDGVRSYETKSIEVTDSLMNVLNAFPEVTHAQRYSTKPGMIKMDNAFQGIIVKGVAQEYDTSFFQANLIEGEIPLFTDSVASNAALISQTLASKLHIKLGDKIHTYYIEDEVRARRFTITGIFQTNFSDYDNNFLITDIYTVTRLKRWNTDQVSGVEIQISDFNRVDEVADMLGRQLNQRTDKYGEPYFIRSITDLNPSIFGWLDMHDLTVWIILILMILVAGFTVISGLLIIILERVSMIGLLKALGANNRTIRQTFLWLAVFLIGQGLFWGNVLGLSLYFIQKQFGIVRLDPETYFVDTFPMLLTPGVYLLLNICTLVVAVLMLVGPSYLITRVKPSDSMRYE